MPLSAEDKVDDAKLTVSSFLPSNYKNIRFFLMQRKYKIHNLVITLQ